MREPGTWGVRLLPEHRRVLCVEPLPKLAKVEEVIIRLLCFVVGDVRGNAPLGIRGVRLSILCISLHKTPFHYLNQGEFENKMQKMSTLRAKPSW